MYLKKSVITGILLHTLILFHFGTKLFAQCAPTIFPSTDYDCTTGLGVLGYTIGGTGASPPYTVTIVNSIGNVTVGTGTTSTNTGTVNNLAIGNYSAFLISSNSCTVVAPFTVNYVLSQGNSSFNTNSVTCFGGADGLGFVVPPSSFIAPYSYTWMPGSVFTQSISSLSAGIIYSVTVTDGQGCKVTNTVSVSQPQEIASTFTDTYVPCYAGTVFTTPTSTGGVGPYTYSINGVSSGTAAILIAGTYSLTAIDSKGCLKTNTIVVTQAPQVQFLFTPVSPSCPGSSDGSVAVTVLNGPTPFTYSWAPVNTGTNVLLNVLAGNYSLTVTDGSACVTKSVITVAPASSIVAIANTHPENCSAADGAFTLNISGGTPPYTYTTYPIMNSNNPIANISSGTYTTIIKDAKLCLDTLKFVVGNLSTVVLSIANSNSISCYNTCNGSVLLNVTNGVSPFTFSATGQATTTSNQFNNLCPGNYVFKVIDAIGCPASIGLSLINPPLFSYSVATPAPICISKQSTLNAVVFGGSPGYSYVWNPGNLNTQQVIVSPSVSTVYSLNVYDVKGCSLAPYQVTLEVLPPIAVVVNANNTGICPGGTAQITPTVSGGDGNYTYLWLPGNSSDASLYIENIFIPTFTLFVNDQCGSPTNTQVIQVKIFEVAQPTFTTSASTGCAPFCATFLNTTPNAVTSIWNFGDSPNQVLGDSSLYCYQVSGNYNVNLTTIDNHSCLASYTYTNSINVIAAPLADFVTDPLTIVRSTSQNVLFKSSSNNANTFVWFKDGELISEEQDFTYSFNEIGCSIFKLLARNASGCLDSVKKNICVLEDFNFFMPSAFTPNGDGINDLFYPEGTGWLEENYSFQIFNRWGHLIFYTSSLGGAWNGNFRENNANASKPKSDQQDTYVWKVAISDNQGQMHYLNGSVVLLK